MKLLPLLALGLVSSTVSALPIIVDGQAVNLTKADFVTKRELFTTENGVDRYAEVGYELKVPLVGSDNLPAIDVHLTGEVVSAWYSSNFGMSVSLYCNNTQIGSDVYFGVRYNRVSYAVKPHIVENAVSIPQGCDQVTLQLNKLGSLSRQYYTNIRDIDLRLYLLERF